MAEPTVQTEPAGQDGAPTRIRVAAERPYEVVVGHGVLGEIVVSAPHLKDRYDALWHTDQQSKRDGLWRRDGRVWHRTADIGHFDAEGRVWLEGRLQPVITTPEGPLGPGGPEKTVDALGPVRRSAVVGVGPRGTQDVVVVVEDEYEPQRWEDPATELFGLYEGVPLTERAEFAWQMPDRIVVFRGPLTRHCTSRAELED